MSLRQKPKKNRDMNAAQHDSAVNLLRSGMEMDMDEKCSGKGTVCDAPK